MDYLTYGYLGLFISSFLSATIFPFASEAVFGIMLLNGFDPVVCTLVATGGNFLGGATSYYIGKLGNWRWIETYFRVKRERVEKSKFYLDRYGAFLALLSWVPLIGDVIIITLGFYRVRTLPVFIYMLVGKLFRYLVIAMAVIRGGSI